MELRDFYKKRASEFAENAKALQTKYISYSVIRLLIFVIGVGALGLLGATLGWLWSILGIVVFLILFAAFVRWHQRLQAEQQHKAQLAKVNEYEARAQGYQFDQFADGARFVDPLHPYTVDLDIFGPHSFFQFINRTATALGQNRLANYLDRPADLPEIAARQKAIAELSDQLEWRQHFQAYGLEAEDELEHIKALQIWLDEPDFMRENTGLKLALWLVPIWMTIGVVASVLYLPGLAFLGFLLIPGLIINKTLERVNKTHVQTTHADKILSFYARLIRQVEDGGQFTSPKLQQLRATFSTHQPKASGAIKTLSYFIAQLNVRYNAFAVLFNVFVLWDLHWVLRLEKWKARHREHLPAWFEALAELEALSSMANLHYNQRDWTFPELQTDTQLQAEVLGHPLIPPGTRICNDLGMPTRAHIKLVTGSNMAGKSTFLRTVGLNIVLAMSGSVVCARRFALPPLKVYTSMRTQDALHESTSSFYAELKRLKFIIEAVEESQQAEAGVYFLLDEILKGTNSRDRHTGSRALIRQLINSRGCGIIATHDLELGALEATAGGAVENLCMEVEVRGDELLFDYQLKKGVSQSFNATQLMRSMGIRIGEG